MNTTLRRVAMTLMALIVLLLANATLTQVFTADGLRADPRNQRILRDEYSRQRGQITAGHQPLAYSVASDDRLRYQRVYSTEPFAYAPITGFYSLRFSSSGLERAEDSLLNGSDERLFGQRLADFFAGRDPRGGNVGTTIVPRVQQAGWDELQQGCGGPCRGAVVALEPATGKILALVSSPSYNPGLLASHNAQIQGDEWDRLGKDPASPLTNRAIAETYPPGSTFKVITTAAALQTGADEETRLPAAAQLPLRGTTTPLTNYGGQPCGAGETVSLREAFERSCNTAFAQLALGIKVDALRSTAEAFGVDDTSNPIPLQVADSTLGPIPDDAALEQSSIGQRDVALTPLQNALIAATVANHGVTMRPYLVDSLEGPGLANLSTTAPVQQRTAIDPDIAARLTQLMIAAETFTQQSGAIPGVQIASKTGTAEHGTNARGPHAWYIAFAPAQDPKVAVAVLVEDGGNLGQSATGGKLAAPIGRAVIKAALQEES